MRGVRCACYHVGAHTFHDHTGLSAQQSWDINHSQALMMLFDALRPYEAFRMCRTQVLCG